MKTEYSFGDILMKAENISLELGGKKILRDIDVTVKDILVPGRTTGQIIGLLGPSGRGKTQLFKILSGINKPTTGSVMVGDFEKGKSHPVKAGDVGVVYQNYPLFEHLTIWRNLELALRMKDVNDNESFLQSVVSGFTRLFKGTKPEHKEKIETYLKRFGLYEHKDKYPVQLSGGQRQRIAIIQQLFCSEHYILMDEPFSGLDPLMTHEVCKMIQEIADLDEENTIIVISHDIASTLAIADIVWLLGNDYEKNPDDTYKLDEAGQKIPIPGARIKYDLNLMDLGLTWDPEISNKPEPEFSEVVGRVRSFYNDL